MRESGVPVSSPHGPIGAGTRGVMPSSACLHARLDQRIKLLLDGRSQWLPATTKTTNSVPSQKCNDCLSDEERWWPAIAVSDKVFRL
jgi:hypothetical protein